MRLSHLAALVVLCFGAACSRFDLVNIDPEDFEGKVTQGVVFDPQTGMALDVYQPPGDGAARPTIVFWYGGSWQFGDREDYLFVGVELARRGFNVVIPDYRKYPDVTYPAFVQDAAAAVAWTHANIARYGGDPDQIVLMGHSAGGHSAVMLAADERFLAAHNLSPSDIRGVIGLAGPYHFSPRFSRLKRIFNGEENFPKMQAGNFIGGDEPPMVLLHGKEDTIVDEINIDRLTAQLKRNGVCHQVRLYPQVGHYGIVGAFTWVYPTDPVVSDIADFARKLTDGSLC